MMRKCAVVAVAVVGLALTAFAAEDKAAPKKPMGAWKHTAGDNTVTFHFGENTVRTVVDANGNTIEVESDYGMSKDGVIFGRIAKVTKKGTDEGPAEGELFSLKIAIDKDTLTVSDFKSSNDREEVKQLINGDYQREKPAAGAKVKD
jgi:hypothetical protein